MLAGMSTRAYRRWCIVAVLLVVYVLYRLTLHWMVAAKLNTFRAQGLPVTLTELNQWYPQPPPGENAGDRYSQALSQLNPWTNNWVEVLRRRGRGRGRGEWDEDPEATAPLAKVSILKRELLPIVDQAKLPKRSAGLSNDVRRICVEYLTDNAEALKLLHGVSAVPPCRYPIDLTNGYETLLPHLSRLREMVRLLSLEAIIAAEEGDSQKAADAIRAGFGWARSLDREPILISQLVRIACFTITVDGLERTLSRTSLTDTQLEGLRKLIHEMETSQPIARSMEGERCFGTALFRRSVWQLSGGFIPATSRWSALPQIGVYKVNGLMDLDHLHLLRFMDRCSQVWQSPLPARLQNSHSLESTLTNQPSFCLLSGMLLPSLSHVVVKDARSIARLRATETALIIERYRVATGRLPNQLSDCAPTFFVSTPVDPCDGQSLRYRRLAQGYVVYSSGEDGNDDGGSEKKDVTFTVER